MKNLQRTLVLLAAIGLIQSQLTQGIDAQQSSSTAAEPQQLAPLDAGLESIRAKDIQAHVDFLASDALKGRYAKSPEAKLAADYLAKHFKQYGLEPMGDQGTFFQEVPGYAPNVVGVVRGKGPDFIILSAHYDHLKPKTEGADRIFNGADDNASGCAAVLEIAQAMGKQAGRLEASLVFIGFTAEEGGLRGSKYFVKQAPMKLERIRGVFNMDMISRGKENLIFCEGGDKAPLMLESVKLANKRVKLDVRYGTHPEWISMSDQYSFVQRDVAALYFGVEDHADYHQVSDHSDKILPGLSAKVAQLVYLAANELGSM